MAPVALLVLPLVHLGEHQPHTHSNPTVSATWIWPKTLKTSLEIMLQHEPSMSQTIWKCWPATSNSLVVLLPDDYYKAFLKAITLSSLETCMKI